MKLNPISFTSQNTKTNKQSRKKGGIIPALASSFIAGSGHFLNGNNKDGAHFLTARLLANFLYTKNILKYNQSVKENIKKTGKAIGDFSTGLKMGTGVVLSVALGMLDALNAYYNKSIFDNKNNPQNNQKRLG